MGGEILIKQEPESETDHGNVVAKHDKQARWAPQRMRRRIARASCHRASGERDGHCSSPCIRSACAPGPRHSKSRCDQFVALIWLWKAPNLIVQLTALERAGGTKQICTIAFHTRQRRGPLNFINAKLALVTLWLGSRKKPVQLYNRPPREVSERKGFGDEADRGSMALGHKVWTPS